MATVTWARLALVLLICFLVQVTLLDQFVVLGAHADVLVLVPAAAGLAAGPQRGALAGFFCGLLADLVVQLPYGLSSLTFVLIGFGAGLLVSVPVGRDLLGAETVSCAALGVVAVALYAVLGTVTGQHALLSSALVRSLVVVGLGGLVLSFPVLWLVRWSFAGSGSASAYAVPSGGSALG